MHAINFSLERSSVSSHPPHLPHQITFSRAVRVRGVREGGALAGGRHLAIRVPSRAARVSGQRVPLVRSANSHIDRPLAPLSRLLRSGLSRRFALHNASIITRSQTFKTHSLLEDVQGQNEHILHTVSLRVRVSWRRGVQQGLARSASLEPIMCFHEIL